MLVWRRYKNCENLVSHPINNKTHAYNEYGKYLKGTCRIKARDKHAETSSIHG